MSSNPDQALEHHYAPRGMNQDIPMFEGEFSVGEEVSPAMGTVTWQWGRYGRIKVEGTHDLQFADPIREFFEQTSYKRRSIWAPPDSIDIDLPDGVIPPQPNKAPAESTDGSGHATSIAMSGKRSFEAVLQQALGNPSSMDRVTFLIPNGWEAYDASVVSDAAHLDNRDDALEWFARTVGAGDGWRVTFDMVRDMLAGNSWRNLENRGGMQFTHIGELRRLDGSTFNGDEAFAVLDRVRVALNIALGRRVSCTLPVGYLEGNPIWTRWRTAPVDRFGGTSEWVTPRHAAHQIGLLVGLVLDATSTPAAWGALKSAVAYYTAARDANVDLTVALPVSAMQTLAYYRFKLHGTMSNTKWEKLATEGQLRTLLEDAKLDLAVPAHLVHLEAARAKLSAAKQPGDALTTLVQMRNVVTHPTNQLPYDTYTIYEWAEAGMVSSYWLCLVLLKMVGYKAEIALYLESEVPFAGQTKDPPWI